MKDKPALPLPADYADWLASLKSRIQGARHRALLSANAEQIHLYHDIGRDILERQSRQGWGAKVIDQLSSDLRAAFPSMKGFSTTNLKYMRFFAEHCPDRQFVQQSAAQFPQPPIGQQSADQSPAAPTSPTLPDQLPWFHIVTLLTKLDDPALREWYAGQAVRHSWPRDTLTVQIKNQLHLRQGQAITNFDQRLAPPLAGLATEIPAPTVRSNQAQGNALGSHERATPALKGRPKPACRHIAPARECLFPSTFIPQPSSLA